MKLIIAEKPSMGRDIAQALGATQKHEGCLSGNGYIVTWAVGHLIELAEPDIYDPGLKSWSLSSLPFVPETFKYSLNPKTATQFKLIKTLVNDNRVQSLVNGCDSGREGELIFHLIYLIAGCKKPVERLWISSLTKADILEGFRNLKPASHYVGLRDSAHARQRADFLIGINTTRSFTIKANQGGVYSVGRVQTPTLALIVERESEIVNFTPETFFQVIANFYSNSGGYQGIWIGQNGFRIDTEQEAKDIADKVSAEDQVGEVIKVDKKLIKEKSPLLHDLTSLQRIANTKYGFTAQQTLDIAQLLYEAKFITYPRTSSQYLSTSLAREITDHLAACDVPPYQQFISQIEQMGIRLTTRHVDDSKITDHHAIIPTKTLVNLSELDEDQQKLYDLIARRFLAAFFPDSEAEQTTVHTFVAGEKFTSKGKVIVKVGWKIVETTEELLANPNPFSKSKGNSSNSKSNPDPSEEDKLLPPLAVNQQVQVKDAQAQEKQTKPPTRFTEATLLGAMKTAGKKIDDEVLKQAIKDQGLGTPATRANIIETLISREYVIREKKSLKPTEKGRVLIELLPSELLKSPRLTAEWEQKLAAIEKGKYSLMAFMAEVKQETVAIVKEIVNADIAGLVGQRMRDKKLENILPCPKCVVEGNNNNYLVEINSPKGKFLVCSSGKENCSYLTCIPKNLKEKKELVETRCPKCQGAMRFYLAKDSSQSNAFFCLNSSSCRHAIWLNNASGGKSSGYGGKSNYSGKNGDTNSSGYSNSKSSSKGSSKSTSYGDNKNTSKGKSAYK